MGNHFFFRLALTNIKRDKRMYLPFAVASTAFVSIYFMVVTIMYSKGIADVPAGRNLQDMFAIGMVIMNIITVIFMLYINSFLIKRRKKEFGLYGILGLEKRHVGRVILWENFILSISSLAAGIIGGCVFGKLIFLIIYYSLKVSARSRFMLPYQAFLYSAVLFLGIFLLTALLNLLQIRLANPIDLLKGDRMGEKKARFILLKTFIGGLLLGWAYYSALTVGNAMSALNQFLLAVIAVIAASFLLFEAGSLFILTILKGRKKIFYKANNFVAISGLFHRMKQNAAGLASICILSTMVLVTVSTCTALYLGQEEMLKNLNPNDIVIRLSEGAVPKQINQLDKLTASLSEKYKIKVTDQYSYDYYSASLILENGSFYPLEDIDSSTGNTLMDMADQIRSVNIITIDDYNKICNRNETLAAGEVLMLTGHNTKGDYVNTSLAGEFKIKTVVPDTKFLRGKNSDETYTLFFVVTGKEEGFKLHSLLYPYQKDPEFNKLTIMNLEGSAEKLKEFAVEMHTESVKIKNVSYFGSIFTDREEGYGIYGGLLFLGIFFTLLFLVATVLIIYFKQISEGYDDKERFIILQKVGMDDLEVKRSINKQILIVFFLPLFGALLHVTMARHMILKLLEAFSLYNTQLTTWCVIITCLVFVLSYVMVYGITAKTYYKIVKW